MRLYPPMYPGDSMLLPGTFSGGSAAKTGKPAYSRTYLVQSTIDAKDAPAFAIDLAAIEARARAARAAWVGSALKSMFQAMLRKFERGDQAEMEHYLAASENLSDLELRIRRYERMRSQGG